MGRRGILYFFTDESYTREHILRQKLFFFLKIFTQRPPTIFSPKAQEFCSSLTLWWQWFTVSKPVTRKFLKIISFTVSLCLLPNWCSHLLCFMTPNSFCKYPLAKPTSTPHEKTLTFTDYPIIILSSWMRFLIQVHQPWSASTEAACFQCLAHTSQYQSWKTNKIKLQCINNMQLFALLLLNRN